MSEARVDLNAFRTEVRNWLADNLPPELRQAHNRATSVFVEKEFNLAWQATGRLNMAGRAGTRRNATSSRQNARGQGRPVLRRWA